MGRPNGCLKKNFRIGETKCGKLRYTQHNNLFHNTLIHSHNPRVILE